MYGFSDAQQKRYLKLVDDDGSGAGLDAILRQVEKASGQVRNTPQLKRVPRGFDADHPREALLRCKSLSVGGDRPVPPALFGGDFVGYCVGEFQKLHPLQHWLVQNL